MAKALLLLLQAVAQAVAWDFFHCPADDPNHVHPHDCGYTVTGHIHNCDCKPNDKLCREQGGKDTDAK